MARTTITIRIQIRFSNAYIWVNESFDVVNMSKQQMPWSFYTTLISFAIFFVCLNIYILTSLFGHPLASDLWIVGIVIGFVMLLYSVRMVRIHQRELVETKISESE